MKPKKINTQQEDLFRSRLSNQINLSHELVKLSEMIPWDALEKECADIFDAKSATGRPATPVRLIIGLLLLQHMHNLSDGKVVQMWVENAYWQYFCGYDYLQWYLPVDPSSLTRWRQRLGTERLEKVLSMTVSVAVDVGVVTKKELESVIADTTVMPKNIEFPTDTKLLEKARVKMVKLAAKHGMTLRQNYNLVAPRLLCKIGGYLHAKQMKRARRAIKHFKTLVGRVARDCASQIGDDALLQQAFRQILSQANHLLTRAKTDKGKIYSLHEPDVVCISKGKAHKKYEFGCKVSLSITHKKGTGIITSACALKGNPYDGHTLSNTLSSSQAVSGVKVAKVFVDKGYKGHGVSGCNVFISGQRRGITATIKKQIRRRQAIEPYIGHLKTEGKLGRCMLKGISGDQINALLCAASYNLIRILSYLRTIFAQIWQTAFVLLQFIKRDFNNICLETRPI
jgi:transposase, IS5 family